MFKKFTTSLSKPPLTIFFMKDSWFRVIFYVIFVTFLIVLPSLIKVTINPSMEYQRYQTMQELIKSDFRVDNAEIKDGILTYEAFGETSFDYFSIYLGKNVLNSRTLNFVFEEENLVLYMVDVELDRLSYKTLNLENYDFSSTENADIVRLSVALKHAYEKQTFILIGEVFATYIITLLDYLFIALFMSVLMVFFVSQIPMPFMYRFKLSLYLSTIYAVLQLILILFNASGLNILGIMAVYFYHVWAFRSIKIIPKGVI